jgi:hypothetical protein
MMSLFPLVTLRPCNDRHRLPDDLMIPEADRRLDARHRGWFEPQRLGQFVVEHRLAGDPLRREEQSNEVPAHVAVVVLADGFA